MTPACPLCGAPLRGEYIAQDRSGEIVWTIWTCTEGICKEKFYADRGILLPEPDAIAEALERIRALEGRDGYEGPTITGYISSVAAMQDLMVRGGGDFMPKVIEDAIVGAVGRGCDKMPLHWEGGRNNNPEGGYIFAISRLAPGYDGDHFVQNHEHLISEIVADSLALAALRAWEEAIGVERR